MDFGPCPIFYVANERIVWFVEFPKLPQHLVPRLLPVVPNPQSFEVQLKEIMVGEYIMAILWMTMCQCVVLRKRGDCRGWETATTDSLRECVNSTQR